MPVVGPTLQAVKSTLEKRLRRSLFELNEAGREHGEDSGTFLYCKGHYEGLLGLMHYLDPNFSEEDSL